MWPSSIRKRKKPRAALTDRATEEGASPSRESCAIHLRSSARVKSQTGRFVLAGPEFESIEIPAIAFECVAREAFLNLDVGEKSLTNRYLCFALQSEVYFTVARQ